MVSTITILKDYYNISTSNSNKFFSYQNNNYYISNNTNINKYYLEYIYLLKDNTYQIVYNKFNQPISSGYMLYRYDDYDLNIQDVISSSLIIVNQKKIKEIKDSWIKIIDDVYQRNQTNNNYYNSILNNLYFALGQCAIEIINTLDENTYVPLSYQHHFISLSSKYIFNPDNIILSSRISNLVNLYLEDYLQDEDIINIINEYQLNYNEVIYMFAKACFPSYYYYQIINNTNTDYLYYYRLINDKLLKIKNLNLLLSKYTNISIINWL